MSLRFQFPVLRIQARHDVYIQPMVVNPLPGLQTGVSVFAGAVAGGGNFVRILIGGKENGMMVTFSQSAYVRFPSFVTSTGAG